ncbi:MAG TPA: type II toxin-antitoxin system HicA family toxin [Candidatus Nitrosotenuis sp.]
MTNGKYKVTIPRHNELRKGTLLSIIGQSRLDRNLFS